MHSIREYRSNAADIYLLDGAYKAIGGLRNDLGIANWMCMHVQQIGIHAIGKYNRYK